MDAGKLKHRVNLLVPLGRLWMQISALYSKAEFVGTPVIYSKSAVSGGKTTFIIRKTTVRPGDVILYEKKWHFVTSIKSLTAYYELTTASVSHIHGTGIRKSIGVEGNVAVEIEELILGFDAVIARVYNKFEDEDSHRAIDVKYTILTTKETELVVGDVLNIEGDVTGSFEVLTSEHIEPNHNEYTIRKRVDA